MVVSVQRSVGRYLLIAGGLLLRAAASIWICRKNSWHHAVTGIHPCEHSLPSRKAAWSTTLTVKQALVCLPVPTKGWCTEDRLRSDGGFAKSLEQLSLAGRPMGTAYKPRSQVPSQYGYDESLLPTSAKPTSRMVSPKCIAAPITTPRLNSTPRLVPSRWCRCRDDVRVWCLWSIRAKSPGSRRSPTRSTSRMLAVPGQGSPAGGVLRCLCNMERVTENEPHPRPAHDSARGARGPASTADQH